MKTIPLAAREARRLQAWKLHQQGWSQRAIAALLEVGESTVSQWFKRARLAGGAKGLHRRKALGAARRLPRTSWRELRVLLRQGAEAHGFRGALWTRAGRRAHPAPLRRGVHSAPRGPFAHRHELERAKALAPRPPARRGEDRALAHRALARSSSKAKRLGQSIFFVDESGFYPLPAVVRTYAPRGQTPVLHEWCTRDHLSLIAAVSAEGRLHVQVREHAFDAVAVTKFLQHLLRVVSGKLLVIWDGAPIHRSKTVQAFLQAKTNGRLELEPLLGYAPDLNLLDCGVWHWLKNVALANVCATDLADLKHKLRAAVTRLRRKPAVIKASFAEAKLHY